MKPMFESINLSANTSLKVETYENGDYCESAGWHIHPEYELVYVKNGTGQLNIGPKKIPYTNGVLVFLAGNIPHGDFGNKDHDDNLEIVIQFGKDFFEEKLKVFPEFSEIQKLVKKSEQVLIFDKQTHQMVWKDFQSFREIDSTQRLIKLLSILFQLSKGGGYTPLFENLPMDNYRKEEIERLEEIFEYINKNHDGKVSVEVISSQLGLTPNSFSRFFKKMTQRRFLDFVNEFRTSKAVEFFNGGETTITGVMYQCGFNDPSYFSKQFKKYQGCTPSQYLKSRYQADF
ncbi:helix-turn-helix domain-containing protein [Muricauda sp. JGD-17]|uniref:Helix-turn-helix domain-containing protein n=1 Tax=Flagellimonas ochracea TaxID=2696472 RepID=A0A964TE61_9FLAO|nr:AraC family transcriptional regulator [Allomuricauda ochracea]NAY92481.1 helix-turn-helix domain-containing protein [Allomuricauda ochracea]